MKYSVGQKVKIRSLEWYQDNVNRYGIIECGKYEFFEPMNEYCGKVVTIKRIDDDNYRIDTDKGAFCWTDEMIEGLVEEESEKKLSDKSWKPSKEEMDVLYGLAYLTNKYDEHKEEVITRLYQDLKREFFNDSSYENMFPDTEDDVRRRSTIQVLEYARSLDNYNQYGKADIDKNIAWLEKQGKSALEARTDNELVEEEVGLVDNLSSGWVNEFNLPDGYIFKDENGNVINAQKIVLEKKKKEYPKTYEECAKIITEFTGLDCNLKGCIGYMSTQLTVLQKLLICRDAYWKIAGEEMGLGKPWKPDFKKDFGKWSIECVRNKIEKGFRTSTNCILIFPTEKMRDAFKENFDPGIEICKELL